jgi:hypothetical protein
MRKIISGLVVGFALGSGSLADTVTITPVKDNTIYEQDDTSNGQGSFLFAGKTGQIRDSLRRALLAFDIAGSVPAGSTITSASLTLNLSKAASNQPFDFSLHRLLKDWGEGTSNAGQNEGQGADASNGDATWSQAIVPDVTWTNLGGDFSMTPSATTSAAGLGKYTWSSSPALVSDVQSWLDDSASNFGWILIGNETTSRSARRFDSRESPNAGNRPSLLIEFTGDVGGDFNGNGALDAADIDALTAEVLAGTNQARFDLNNDQLVNSADRTVWVVDIKKTYFGDANLDGLFGTDDFVAVFVAGQYEDGVAANSTWATGDWNGDSEFDTADFVVAFQGGGFEKGPRMAVAVPEPHSFLALLAGVLCLVGGRRAIDSRLFG